MTGDRSELLARAHVALRENRVTAANRIATSLLAEDPSDLEATVVLVHSALLAGELQIVVALVEHVLRAAPDEGRLLTTLGIALDAIGDEAGARVALERATATENGRFGALIAAGALEHRLGRTAEALGLYREAAGSRPEHPEAGFRAANALLGLGREDEARAAYARVTAAAPTYVARHRQLARELADLGQFEAAAEVVRCGIRLEPSDRELEHVLLGLTRTDVTRASDDYVETHFDRFAATFDATLRDELEYRGPELLLAGLRSSGWSADDATVLDAGCGTGLAAPLLRPLAAVLIGVDLSAQMLARARDTGLYDELHHREIGAALADWPERFDLISASDVLIYFGDLVPVFTAAAASLRPGGAFAVSAERHDGDGHALLTSGRFAHSETSLRNAAASAGLAVMTFEPCVVRLERARPVRGYVVVARRRP